MGLFGRKKTTVGLDIGSGLVKVAVVDHSKSTPELVKVAITPLPDDAIVEGEVMDPHVLTPRGPYLVALVIDGRAIIPPVPAAPKAGPAPAPPPPPAPR